MPKFRRQRTAAHKQVVARPSRDVTAGLPVLQTDVAGIDVGSAKHYVAVPPDRDPEPIRSFGSFTGDCYRLVKWLLDCGIKRVVMQATGVYWFGLYQVLEDHGLEINVTNAAYTKMLPGRKTDVHESEWLRQLETYGLLTRSFRPTEEIRVLRSLMRQRESLVTEVGVYIQRMQKTLTEMNIQLTNVLSDISGKSGMAILRAIVDGNRDPEKLAKLCDRHVRATRQEIAASLEGNWRAELLFILEQNLHLYDFYCEKIAACDQQIEAHLQTIDRKLDALLTPLPEPRRRGLESHRKHAPEYPVRKYLYEITGVDLTRIDGIGPQTAQVVISEIGVDMSKWRTEKSFTSWLGLCPANEKTGGKVIKRGTKKVVNRAANALRIAAQALERSESTMGAKYRRLKRGLGAPRAITAMARQLAVLIYRALRFGNDYVDKGVEHYEKKFREQQVKSLQKQAAKHGFQLVPVQAVAQ
jgi:transposase